MTEEVQQASETPNTQPTDQNASNTTSENIKTKEGKKEKCKPMTKVVIRRLPPTMTQEQFLEQVAPLPEYDYMYFAKADTSLGSYAFSRAYIDFLNQEDIFGFREKFDNYVFVDAKGTEYSAVVEYAPFQRIPKKRVGKKKDLKCGTIESDPYFISFLESLKNQEIDPTNAQPKTEYSFQPSDHAPKKVTTTPLLDFLKQRKQEKQRLREEKREEKRRRDLERKRSKDEPLVPKVLKNIDDKERDKDKEISRENKENKDDKEKLLQKDLKNRNKKEDRYKDKIGRDRDLKFPVKNFRDRDDRFKDRDIKLSKKSDDKKFYNKKEEHEICIKENRTYDKEEVIYKERRLEEKRGKSYEKMRLEKRKLAELQKKLIADSVLEESEKYQESINETDENEKDAYMINSEEKNRKNMIDAINDVESDSSEQLTDNFQKTKTESDHVYEGIDRKTSAEGELYEICERLTQSSLEDDDNDQGCSDSNTCTDKKSLTKLRITKRRSSLESGGENGTGVKVGGHGLSSGSNGDNGDHDSSSLRRHKSLDGGKGNDLQKNEVDDKEKDKKDPRLERRIRNKDRPAMEIYKPGMGKFSKQRLEREKGNEDRATPCQSPTPTSTNSNTFKSGKTAGSEVRSMTFKRSFSRDIS